MASTDADRPEEESHGAGAGAEDEDTGAQVAPIVRLEEVAVTTGEEDENVLLDLKAKLYRFDNDGNQWKERGVGNVKLLKHKETGKVRLVMRQSKTLKICANHYVFPSIKVKEHVGNDKSCVWKAPDFADGELKDETFCIRFGSIENCKKFMTMVEEIAQGKTEIAELMGSLKVGDASGNEKEEAKTEAPVAEKKEEETVPSKTEESAEVSETSEVPEKKE